MEIDGSSTGFWIVLLNIEQKKDLILCHVLCEFGVIPAKRFGIIPVHPFYTFHKSCSTVYAQERKHCLLLTLHSFQNKYKSSAKTALRPQVSMTILYANLSISCYYQF